LIALGVVFMLCEPQAMIDFDSITRVPLGIGVMGRRSEVEPSGCSLNLPALAETLTTYSGEKVGLVLYGFRFSASDGYYFISLVFFIS